LTKAEILALNNHALNIAVAVHVIGWKRECKDYFMAPAHKTRAVIKQRH
jgi:hypothetical protein